VTGRRPPLESVVENVWEAPKAPIGVAAEGRGDAPEALHWVGLGYVGALIGSAFVAIRRPDPLPIGIFIGLVLAFFLVSGVVFFLALVRLVRWLRSLVMASWRGRSTPVPNGDWRLS
jgi:hypothetical protein